MVSDELEIRITFPALKSKYQKENFIIIHSDIIAGGFKQVTFYPEKSRLYSELGKGLRFYPSNKYWMSSAEELGIDLKKNLWDEEEIKEIYNQALREKNEECEKIHFVFEGDETSLSLPLELMCEDSHCTLKPLIIKHPISRKITTRCNRRPLCIADLDRSLNILLISSQTNNGGLEHISEEIDEIKKIVKSSGPKHKVCCLENPSFSDIHNVLGDEEWHLLHFAGHGAFEGKKEENGIFLNGNGGKSEFINQNKINRLIKDKGRQLKFIFFNCCEGGCQTDIEPQFLKPDLMGIMHGLIEARVPSFVAFRWRIDDMTAFEFSKSFYHNVFYEKQNLRRALFETRLDIHELNKLQNAWISSVLVINGKE